MYNITLIGMPASGKTTIGKMVAEMLQLDFIDTDDLVREKVGQPISDFLGEYQINIDKFRKIEEDAVSSIRKKHIIISTGGSVIYSEKSMRHLKKRSLICYLDVTIDTIKYRIPDPFERGVLMGTNSNLDQLYQERQSLYEKYADFVIEESSMEKMAKNISNILR